MSPRNYKQWIAGLGILVLTLLPLVGKAIGAEEYPAQTIKVICGYSAGGGTDVGARMILPFVQKHLGKSIILENMPGASGILATNKVFSSPPDGYTLMVATSLALPLLEKYYSETSRYKSLELTHIASYSREDQVLISHPEVWKDFPEFIKAAKSRRLRVAISGKGIPAHLYSAMLGKMANVDFNIIPYGGGGECIAAVAGKHADVHFGFVTTVLQLIRSGTVNPLLVLADQRNPNLPQVPIPKEVGFKSYEHPEYINGIFGPPKLPADRVKVLEEALAKAVKDPEYLQKAKGMLLDIYNLNSKDFLARTEKAYSQVEEYINILKGTGS